MVNTSDFRETRSYACGKYTLDLMYSCKTCKNYCLQKTCTELQEKIDRHPFHCSHALAVVFNGSSYACCVCRKKCDKLLYYCNGCNFTLNLDCTLNPTSTNLSENGGSSTSCTIILLLSQGTMSVGVEESKTCLACEKQCSSEESYYSCNICRAFSLHTSCMESLPRVIWHPSHPEHPIDASSERSVVRSAMPCGRTDNVLSYRCSMCRVEMDPGCALKQTNHRNRHDANKTHPSH